eukprot:scaffold38648_cov17-Tisochrysis_lutea.AAC.3
MIQCFSSVGHAGFTADQATLVVGASTFHFLGRPQTRFLSTCLLDAKTFCNAEIGAILNCLIKRWIAISLQARACLHGHGMKAFKFLAPIPTGESILIVQPQAPQYSSSSLAKLITDPPAPITTCLAEGKRGMNRAMLELQGIQQSSAYGSQLGFKSNGH